MYKYFSCSEITRVYLDVYLKEQVETHSPAQTGNQQNVPQLADMKLLIAYVEFLSIV